nr:MAG TPA: hypothetical protein [Caudoviricetes sp.]
MYVSIVHIITSCLIYYKLNFISRLKYCNMNI